MQILGMHMDPQQHFQGSNFGPFEVNCNFSSKRAPNFTAIAQNRLYQSATQLALEGRVMDMRPMATAMQAGMALLDALCNDVMDEVRFIVPCMSSPDADTH